MWFTDGIVEAEDAWGEQFSDKRLRAIAQRAAPQGAVAIRDAIIEAVSGFKQDRPQADDMTLVTASIV